MDDFIGKLDVKVVDPERKTLIEKEEERLNQLNEANLNKLEKMTTDDISFESIFTDVDLPKNKQVESLNNRLRTFFVYKEVNDKGETVEKIVDQQTE